MWWAEKEIGLQKLVLSIFQYAEKFQEVSWWQPSKLLKDIVESGSSIQEELYFRKQQSAAAAAAAAAAGAGDGGGNCWDDCGDCGDGGGD